MDFLIDNFKHLTITPENVEQLKKLVLQMAVQSKLTAKWREENPVVEPASVLLKRIKVQKEQLIKEGKIKRQKPLQLISNEEKPYNLPDSWKWERLGNIGLGFEYGTSSKSTNAGEVPVLRMRNIQDGKITWDSLVFSSSESDNKTYLLQEHDLLFNRTNSRELVGKTALFSSHRKAIFAGYLVRFRMLGQISSLYTNYVMNSPLHRNWCDEVKTDAIGQSNINATKLKSFKFPLPPIEEQQAIVSQVEKLFTQIDQLHAFAQKRLNYREKSAKALFSKINHAGNDTELQETWQTLTAHFHTLTQSKESVRQLRQSILQMAVQGKLTAQWRDENPDVEPAKVLLERIKAEKEQLIKNGNIKKQKTLHSVSNDEKPFALPESWEWIRLANTGEIYNGNSISKSDKETLYCNVKKGIPYLSTKDIGYGTIIENYNTGVYIPQNEPKFKIAKSNSVLICSEGGSAGKKISFITRDICFGNKLLTNSNFTGISSIYVFYLYQSSYFSDAFKNSMSGLIGGISMSNFKLLPFALPPFEEQKAIVTKVKQLMSWCDDLEKKIEKRDGYQEKMMQAVVKQALKTEKETVEVL